MLAHIHFCGACITNFCGDFLKQLKNEGCGPFRDNIRKKPIQILVQPPKPVILKIGMHSAQMSKICKNPSTMSSIRCRDNQSNPEWMEWKQKTLRKRKHQHLLSGSKITTDKLKIFQIDTSEPLKNKSAFGNIAARREYYTSSATSSNIPNIVRISF